MTKSEFELVKKGCRLDDARFDEGSFLTGRPSIIDTNEDAQEVGQGQARKEQACVDKLLGVDRLARFPSINFQLTYVVP
ncbi:MAG TPA: hypothetical protein VK533_02975 [Sphingomonas sp.]|uniref:hypothetical protein n=1 Tax=Sphingomonas sp. TaxID=28214 RepID=UPI002CCA501A|nr:hypothetical protein [Sphingomonas sp.]HMI18486.1 hypothetical protein [Sphingomonas sp.]